MRSYERGREREGGRREREVVAQFKQRKPIDMKDSTNRYYLALGLTAGALGGGARLFSTPS
jgi:hypothetical protein